MSITKFFRNVSSEMRKVSWPTRKELVKYTITVIATVAFLTLFFVVIDLGISAIIRWAESTL
ncbi:protein translocase subunit SecE [Weizmannia acidilactici]|uniref:Protein translocase subunit SecE n=1 Tax=Weizmannia acidilactici TaxID=2607726 RepID=A0A5J4JHG7_9BACI|nr:preprotein translocase subunit SecE [Weizmannia acidilactici]GER67275.1 protein translocase subunit SecE [Weizmannia acidilactici]GER69917.1 protein translocase subunit SecE [Weizmannia acidilactici]GER73304.1 protein translocase subunit SecE [Weizmannia acidilactici]